PQTKEGDSGIVWYPRLQWGERDLLHPMARIFGDLNNRYAVAWTKLTCTLDGASSIVLKGRAAGIADIFIDGNKIAEQTTGDFSIPLNLSYGRHDLHIRCAGTVENWGFRLDEL
ncbi:hypothetical protein K0U00_50220, partial [Paenibacillus sepulcri]|nr:hypothetical protein [Paenibacillus sepulcri]